MPLFYKTREVERALSLIDTAVTSSGHVWIRGDAGLGKTYLGEQIERTWKADKKGWGCIRFRYPDQSTHLSSALSHAVTGNAAGLSIEDLVPLLLGMVNSTYGLLLFVDNVPDEEKGLSWLMKLMSSMSRATAGFGMVMTSACRSDDLFTVNHVPHSVRHHPTFLDTVTLKSLSEAEMMEFLGAAIPAMKPVTEGFFLTPSPDKDALEIARLLHNESRGVFLTLAMLVRLLEPLPKITLAKVKEVIRRRHGR